MEIDWKGRFTDLDGRAAYLRFRICGGLNITDYNDSWSSFFRKEIVNYLKRYEPIGCRDSYTADRLSQLGVETFVSYCLTLTLLKRECQENCDKVIVVDGEGISLPAEFIHMSW